MGKESAYHRTGQKAVAFGLCASLALPMCGVPAAAAFADDFAAEPDAQEQPASSNEMKTVRVGWLLNNQGFQSGMPGEYMSGWGYEYLQTLSYYTPGWKYEYVAGTFTELMDKLENGEIDLMPNISYTDERSTKMLFSSNPEGMEHYYIYAKPNRSDLAHGKPESLNGTTIGCNRNVMQTEVGMQWLEDEGVSCNYAFYDTGNELFNALSAGEVDAIIMNDTLSSEDAMPIFSVGESDYYFVTPLSRQDLMDDINAAMVSINRSNPRYNDEVKTRYSINGSGSSSLTEEESTWLQCRGNALTLGYMRRALPYSDETGDGEMEGSLTALVDCLQDDFSVRVRTVAFDSYDEMKAALSAGSIDVMMPVCKDYYLAEENDSAQSVAMTNTSFVVIYADGNFDNAFDEVAYAPNSLMGEELLRAHYPDASVKEFDSVYACVDAIRNGEATAVIVPVTAMDDLRSKTDFAGLKTAELSLGGEITCWTRRGEPALLSILNKSIANSKDEIEAGAFSRFSYSQGESGFVAFIERHQTAFGMAVVCFLLLTIGVMAWSLRRSHRAKEEAIEASAAKTAFLSRMSHDIRTPLNGIIGLIEVNDLHADDVELGKENRAKARVAADHLLSLINDVLEMGKIENREIVLENKPFDLLKLLGETLMLAKIRASEHAVTIATDGGCNIAYPHVYGSPTHVRRILVNLLDNSIKYNVHDGRIDCSSSILKHEGNTVTYRFVISDTGIGMSQEFQEHIFEPFAQESDDARSNYQGTGLGMPIVQGLLRKMGGIIEVSSVQGEGTTFMLEVPFEIDNDFEAHQEKVQSSECSIGGMHILLAEDNELNAEIAQALLENEGAEVTWAKNGQEALGMYREKPAGAFDAILMDIMMPVMDGYEASRRIRMCSKRDATTIPIIAMTANAFLEDVQAAKEAGMNSHLSKPVDIEVLKRVLAKYFK